MITAFHFAGRWDGTEEAEKINARIARGDKRELTHWWELTVRVVFLLLGLGVMYLIHEWFGTQQWKLFCVAGMAFGAFVPTHRYFVNTRRTNPFGIDTKWLHMGPLLQYRKRGDAVYDYLWHWLAWVVTGSRMVAELDHPTYPTKLPAKLAYAFEAFVLILSTTTYVLA